MSRISSTTTATVASGRGTDNFSRDAAGRVRTVSVGTSHTASSWYGPLGAVVAAENITYNPTADITGGIEEFITDALGNRVWQRQRYVYPHGPYRDGIRRMDYSQGRLFDVSAPSQPGFPNFGYAQGITYDAAGNTTLSYTQRSEGTGGSTHVFQSSRSYYDDIGQLRVTNTHEGTSANTGPGGVVDGDAPWGRVQYIHALGSAAAGGIDMPVQIERTSVYGDGALRFTPFTNWRGQVQASSVAPGSGDMPPVAWPAARLTLDGARVVADSQYYWMGSLANGMTDGSGLQYRRN